MGRTKNTHEVTLPLVIVIRQRDKLYCLSFVVIQLYWQGVSRMRSDGTIYSIFIILLKPSLIQLRW